MPRLHLMPELFLNDRIVLRGADHKYLVRVLRLRPGDELTVFDGQGHERRATLADVGPTSVALALGAISLRKHLPRPAMTLLLGMPKGEKVDLIVQKATELGVDHIVPLYCDRSVPQERADRVADRHARWQKIAAEAARQSGRATVAEVSSPAPWSEVMATAQLQEGASKWVLDPDGARSLVSPSTLPNSGRPMILLVGPEGGLSAAEMKQAHAQGFVSLALSDQTLRVETAAIAAVAVLRFY